MIDYARDMNQAATYWTPGTSGGFGTTYGDPVPLMVRWEDKSELYRDAQGNEVISSAVVYVPMPVEIGGFLALGDHTGTPPEAGAREIRQTGSTVDLDGTVRLSKAIL